MTFVEPAMDPAGVASRTNSHKKVVVSTLTAQRGWPRACLPRDIALVLTIQHNLTLRQNNELPPAHLPATEQTIWSTTPRALYGTSSSLTMSDMKITCALHQHRLTTYIHRLTQVAGIS